EWVDRDYDQFAFQLAAFAPRFRGLEAMVAADPMPQEGMSLIRVAITRSGAAEQESVIPIRQQDQEIQEILATLTERIEGLLNALPTNSSHDKVLAVLALLTERLLSRRNADEAASTKDE